MKKLSVKEEAKQIVDDYYELMNQTYSAGYSQAKKYAIHMMDRRLETPDQHPDVIKRWFELKQEMQQL